MSSPKSVAVIAAAGSGKTESIIQNALAYDDDGRVLITTFTLENQRQIIARLVQIAGTVPQHIEVQGWFTFLLRDGVRPYQDSVLDAIGQVKSLNFIGERYRYTAKTNSSAYFLDRRGDVYRAGLSDFVCTANTQSQGRVVSRLEKLYSHIFIDEVQDLVGYDLDVVDLLLNSSVPITVVGDPRQHTYGTHDVGRNKKYRGAGFVDWLTERSELCFIDVRNTSWRCNQAICDFADALYPELPKTESLNDSDVAHQGIFSLTRSEVAAYIEEWEPSVLRYSKRARTDGVGAMNIGVAKGSTFDRVLIYPTRPMLKFLKSRDPNVAGDTASLYVAITRARHSVAFVVD